MRMEVKKAAQLSLLGAQARRSALEMVYRATSGHLGGSTPPSRMTRTGTASY